MNKTSLIVFLLVLLSISPVFAFDEAGGTVSGIVTDVDWVSSSLTVRYSDPYTRNADEITVRVSKEATINRGTKSISFSDIRQSDRIVVIYYSDDLSGFKARRISDLNQGNR
ncbi:MAG: hypothetical protein Q7K98_03280 [Candidatus Omnitrophota bacterium]|nr:hypothetical protein [Candidatus Omnitrophota bacterium]